MKLIGLRRENSGDNEEAEKGAKDLLGLMINAGAKKKTNAAGAAAAAAVTTKEKWEDCSSAPRAVAAFSVEEMVEECKTFFFAGKQSTSNLLTWTTVLLAMNPEWQELAREEVLEVCGSRDIPTKDDIAKLKTVRSSSHRLFFFSLAFVTVFAK